jgi:alpha-glucosidase
MYNTVPHITEILRQVLNFRYRLAPTFYSLYVVDYHRRGWPLLKVCCVLRGVSEHLLTPCRFQPLLWFHSDDPVTLHLDEEFIFGSHVLVAPVIEKGSRRRLVYLPGSVNGGDMQVQWCELDTGKWHVGEGNFVELGACHLLVIINFPDIGRLLLRRAVGAHSYACPSWSDSSLGWSMLS